MPEHPLQAVEAAIQHLRESQDHFLLMSKEVRPSPSDVHSHVCREVAEVNENLIDIVDAIEDVLILQKGRLDAGDTLDASVDARLDAIEGRLDTAEAGLASAVASLSALQTRMTTAEGRLDVQKARINSIVAYLVEAEKKLKVTESGLAPLPIGIP